MIHCRRCRKKCIGPLCSQCIQRSYGAAMVDRKRALKDGKCIVCGEPALFDDVRGKLRRVCALHAKRHTNGGMK